MKVLNQETYLDRSGSVNVRSRRGVSAGHTAIRVKLRAIVSE
ncbi:MAG TPA: hypothetical protein VE548_13280 [Nitrososphaeraceae archaeon]|nr:hypothetical protein [Nitrososphaeraceae archaeon]